MVIIYVCCSEGATWVRDLLPEALGALLSGTLGALVRVVSSDGLAVGLQHKKRFGCFA
jgi:hypothetical protein